LNDSQKKKTKREKLIENKEPAKEEVKWRDNEKT